MSNIFLLLSYLLHSKNNFELYFRFFHFPAASPLFSCAKHAAVIFDDKREENLKEKLAEERKEKAAYTLYWERQNRT